MRYGCAPIIESRPGFRGTSRDGLAREAAGRSDKRGQARVNLREIREWQLRARVEVAEMRASYHTLIQLYAAMIALALVGLAAWVTRF
ncbi:MAG: hypothetical protein ACYC66_03890 [Chloroflexota bacterium]